MLRKLNTKLHSIQSTLDMHSKLIEKINVDDPSTYNIHKIRSFKRICFPLYDEFQEICTSIQELSIDNASEIKRIDDIRADLYNKYLDIDSIVNEILPESEPESSPNISNSCNHTDNDIELPRISVPNFHGDIASWNAFKSSYISLIHSKVNFTNHKKLHLLRNCLKGEALDIISSVEIDGKNYKLCWELLLETYDNKRQIISHHINSFLNIPNLNLESSDNLRTTASLIRKHVKSLENSIPSEKRWDQIITALIFKKLDSSTKAQWHLSQSSKGDFLTVDSLLSFMLERAHEIDEQREYSKVDKKPKSQRSLVVSQNNKCYFCNGDHQVHQCKTFSNWTVSSRIKEARKHNLCLNCMRKGHLTKKCTSKYFCNICGKMHHTLLHLPLSTSEPSQNDLVIPSTSSDTFTSQILKSCQTLLSTALVKIIDNKGKSIIARA